MPLKKFRNLSFYSHATSVLSYWDNSFTCKFASLYFSKWFNIDPMEIVGRVTLSQLLIDSYKQHLPYLEIVSKGTFQCYECEMDLFANQKRMVILAYYPEFNDSRFMGFYLHMHLKGSEFADNFKTDNQFYLNDNKIAVTSQFLRTQILNDFPSIGYLANKHLLSISKLMRDFKSATFNYYRNLQMEFASNYIKETACSKKQMALILGFSNPGNFNTCYRKWERRHGC